MDGFLYGSGLALSGAFAPAPPKWEPLAVHAKCIVMPRPLPLGELSSECETERASPQKIDHLQCLFLVFINREGIADVLFCVQIS